jgi:hypothetical protein
MEFIYYYNKGNIYYWVEISVFGTDQVSSDGDTFDLYSRNALFESRLAHRVSCLKFFYGFPKSTMQNP